MSGFADRTGLTSDRTPDRYLWTDAFAVTNFLGLYETTGERDHLDLVHRLIEQVHVVLGRHRQDDAREGWISGRDEADGREHPTAGGLRIGKPQRERLAQEPVDARAEWDRDGQYYHYLTRWMHALAQAAEITGENRYHRWAVELAEAAHRGFVRGPDARPPMRWKMSIDLSRPLVDSMGQHDPLDGFVTIEGLRAGQDHDSLASMSAELLEICQDQALATDDSLGAGGLLVDLWGLFRLRARRETPTRGTDLARRVMDAAVRSLRACVRSSSFDAPATQRLGFRELGLAIGLHAVEGIEMLAGRSGENDPLLASDALAVLRAEIARADAIEAFWLDPAHQATSTWQEHRNINEVMLATSLLPDGYLGTAPRIEWPDHRA